MFVLQQVKKFTMPKAIIVHLYTTFVDSILYAFITIWYAAVTAKDKGRRQRIIHSISYFHTAQPTVSPFSSDLPTKKCLLDKTVS